jgi:hypothetical protein
VAGAPPLVLSVRRAQARPWGQRGASSSLALAALTLAGIILFRVIAIDEVPVLRAECEALLTERSTGSEAD